MHPPTTPPTDLLNSLLGQAIGGLLLIPVIWYVLRDLKATVKDGFDKLTGRVNAIELQVAGDSTKHDVRHLKEAHAKLEATVERFAHQIGELHARLATIQSRVSGDCPD